MGNKFIKVMGKQRQHQPQRPHPGAAIKTLPNKPRPYIDFDPMMDVELMSKDQVTASIAYFLNIAEAKAKAARGPIKFLKLEAR